MASDPLETRVTNLELMVRDIDQKVSDIHRVVTDVTSVSNAIVFAKKHGPRIVAFLTGLLAASGMGNPTVLKFIGKFVGS